MYWRGYSNQSVTFKIPIANLDNAQEQGLVAVSLDHSRYNQWRPFEVLLRISQINAVVWMCEERLTRSLPPTEPDPERGRGDVPVRSRDRGGGLRGPRDAPRSGDHRTLR